MQPDGGGRVRVAAAVAVHDRRDRSVAWLRSLLVAARRADVDLEVVVLDDGSTDGTADALRAVLPSVHVITGDGSLYYAAGTNRAVAAALALAPDHLFVANDDTVLDPDCLTRLLARVDEVPRSVAGPVLVADERPDVAFQTFPRWHTWYGGWRHRHHLPLASLGTSPRSVDVIVGNAVLVPAAAVDEQGVMDERGRHNWVGDAEWTPRMRRAGWELVVDPSARVRCAPNPVVPSPLAGGPAALLRALRDPLSPYSLGWLWANRTVSGPDPARGAAAFAVHLARLAGRVATRARPRPDRAAWPDWPDEPVPGPGARPLVVPPAEPFDLVLAWPYLPWGGAQTHLLGVAGHLPTATVRALVPRGTDPHLLDLLAGAGITAAEFGPPVDLDPATGMAAKARRRARDARAHVALWRATRPLDPATTVLHVDLAPWSSALLVRALAHRFAVVQTLHTAPPALRPARRLQWRVKLEWLRAAPNYHLTTGNRDARDGFSALLGRALGAASTPTAADVALAAEVRAGLDATAVRRRLQVPTSAALLVGAGQLVHRKGIDLAVDALARLRRDGHDVVLRWFGDGPERAALEARAARLGVSGHVRLLPPASAPTRADLFAAFAAADVYLQPSREEGLPLALVEAMAVGTAVVAAAVNGVPEAVTDGVDGVLVAPDDAAALADAIAELVSDPSRAARLGDAASRSVAGGPHSLAAVAATLDLVYRRALQRRRPARRRRLVP